MNYLINKKFDSIFIIYSPIISLIAYPLSLFFTVESILLWIILQGFASSTTLFRAYLNKKIRKYYKLELFVVPILLFILMSFSFDFFILCIVFEIFYDVYHSSLQTFGLSRFYSYKDNDNYLKKEERNLSLIIYSIPLLFGIHSHLFFSQVLSFKNTTFDFLSKISMNENFNYLSYFIITFSLFYTISYFFQIKELKTKHILFLNTIIMAVFCGFFIKNYLTVYLIININHSLQTFAITYNAEKSKRNLVIILIGVVLIGLVEGFLDYGEQKFYSYNHIDLKTTLKDVFENNYYIYILMQLRTVFGLMHYWTESFVWTKKSFDIENS